MKTKLIYIDTDHIDPALASQAGMVLSSGGVVAFPTETVYGLGANACDSAAVKKIFVAKGRPADNPLIVHVADIAEVERLVYKIPEPAELVMKNFWPGPISIILKKSDRIPDIVSAGLPTVAIRMPSHPVAMAVIRASGVPVAAPSANISGRPSPTTAAHVLADLDGKIDMVVDGGTCGIGLESTVLDLSGDVPVILRPGGVTSSMLMPLIGEVKCPQAEPLADGDTPKSPGMKYRHYSPNADVYVVEKESQATSENDVSRAVLDLCKKSRRQGKRVGVLACRGIGKDAAADVCIDGGETSDEYGAGLFAALRRFDEQGADIVYAPMLFYDEFSYAIRNRLYKAARGKVIKV